MVYNSTHVSLGKFVYFNVTNLLGIVYVNKVTLRRENSFKDAHNTGCFWITAFFSNPVLFIASMNVNLRGPDDLEGFKYSPT